MDCDFVKHRLTELREKKGVSEYRMSLELDHSKSYIQSISSGKALPSMAEFLTICDYFHITPKEFFDEKIDDPALVNQIRTLLLDLSEADLKAILTIVKRLKAK